MAEWGYDITWFAVDRDGCIAAFIANECGAVPDRLKLDHLEREFHETFAALREATGDEVDIDPDFDLDADDLVPSAVYVYWHDGAWLARPYECNAMPDSPTRSGTLPAAVVARMVAFDGRFADHAELQPVEHWTSRTGRVFQHRYHFTEITSPTQMSHAYSYVLCNWRHHGENLHCAAARKATFDPYSTACRFDGWATATSSSRSKCGSDPLLLVEHAGLVRHDLAGDRGCV